VETPHAEGPPQPIPQSRIVVLVGLPGAGKSTWVAQQQGGAVLSSDEIRRWLSDDATNQTIHRQVFATLRYLLRRRLELRRPLTFIDATNLTRRERRPYIKIGEIHDCEVEAVFFDVPVEVCQERNRARARVVPEPAIEDMARRLAPPSVEEGFARITVVRPDLGIK
jgi:predicted kinase